MSGVGDARRLTLPFLETHKTGEFGLRPPITCIFPPLLNQVIPYCSPTADDLKGYELFIRVSEPPTTLGLEDSK